MPTSASNPEIDPGHLTALVQQSLERPALQLTEWSVQQLHSGMEWDSAVFRVHGEAEDAGKAVAWSLILKTVKPAADANDPAGVHYWKREVLAYQSGSLHRLPGGNVTAPACYQVDERPNGSIWLWLEDVKEDVDSPWSIDQYAAAARHLGQFSGAYLMGHPLPTEPWIARQWLRKYVENAAPMIDFLRANPHHSLAVGLYRYDGLAQILALWDDHRPILDTLDGLPQVLCHQDAFRGNLFARGGKTVLIDWSYLGTAPVGAELVALVLGSVGMFQLPPNQLPELDQRCFESYLLGLRDAGWSGDRKLVRMGYTTTAMMRYTIGGSVGDALPRLLDQQSRSKLETTFEKSAQELGATDPAIIAYYQQLLLQTLRLLGPRRTGSFMGRFLAHLIRARVKR